MIGWRATQGKHQGPSLHRRYPQPSDRFRVLIGRNSTSHTLKAAEHRPTASWYRLLFAHQYRGASASAGRRGRSHADPYLRLGAGRYRECLDLRDSRTIDARVTSLSERYPRLLKTPATKDVVWATLHALAGLLSFRDLARREQRALPVGIHPLIFRAAPR